MTLKRISAKRAARVDLMHNSTFGAKWKLLREVLTIEQMRAQGLLQRAMDVEKRPKVKTDKQRWKAKADKWFSEWIRLRDSDEHGIATCITSGRKMPWRQCDCGHYLSRAKEGTRYDERNAHAQSKQANRFQGGHFMEHGLRIEEKYGEGTCKALEQKAQQPCRRTASDYQFIAETFKARVDWIKQHEPGKYTRG